MADRSSEQPAQVGQACAEDTPAWHRGLDYLRPHLAESESQGLGVQWRDSLPDALAEAQRLDKPVLLQ
ncbi:MAG: hypothetical protein JNM56_35470, partial [Planctomycetia bacterium]|nr:hypothetical protein [Planctomycetia bacterium]